MIRTWFISCQSKYKIMLYVSHGHFVQQGQLMLNTFLERSTFVETLYQEILYHSKNTVEKKQKIFLLTLTKDFPLGLNVLVAFSVFYWPTVRGRTRSAADRTSCHQDDDEVSLSVSSVASESPMISQLEAELLMWVGLRPLPDRVRKPKLPPSRGEERDGDDVSL